MVGILVTGHGHFATGLGSSLKLITGITENVALVDFEADHSTETLTDNISKAMDELKNCEGILVLSDLAGGSPFKCAVECKFARPEQKIEVIAGTNLPMLVEGGMMMGAFDCPREMADALIPTGKDYIVLFELEEHKDNTEEDGI
ncbi:MAG: PTS sugar transporter subunit IIA [Lachnospiraceae bacterium]|nr:PTS sugar transporter subunit IIA [Lachnospiraceae bacterium]MCI7596615.1 PTS sugar transporter subunit IIA [Lachnospiraceae bacterium]MDD7051299.1 PTS sugar transporter subunit IIA [Lachnospiraceae bacterium]MDY3223736.1 PTS sugar transporter subunit IIA [Lachnospiraceae bacterium]MDY4095171.1 PTS sugar transporter subunit IIA [Lachnospiraceae bacterium]